MANEEVLSGGSDPVEVLFLFPGNSWQGSRRSERSWGILEAVFYFLGSISSKRLGVCHQLYLRPIKLITSRQYICSYRQKLAAKKPKGPV
jgi:hypothetical protein